MLKKLSLSTDIEHKFYSLQRHTIKRTQGTSNREIKSSRLIFYISNGTKVSKGCLVSGLLKLAKMTLRKD